MNLVDSFGITDTDSPLEVELTHSDYGDLCLSNPYSKITRFISYIYQMEFGQPPLYSEINRAIRKFDE